MKNEQADSESDFEMLTKAVLHEAYKVHQALGLKGEELVKNNQFGETALRVDIEIEEAVINFLKDENIPIRIISEEHGLIDLTSRPKYLGILDGIDGSNRYKAGRNIERYGTMFAIFSNLDPRYDDYVSSGIMEHSTNRLFIAGRGTGSFVVTQENKKRILASKNNILDNATRIYINEYWEICRKVFLEKLKQYKTTDPRAYATYFSDLGLGNTDLVLTCTGKNNLEIAIGYGFVKEAGALMVDLEGNNLGNRKYLEWGQNEQLPIIVASTISLAQELIRAIK